MVGIRRVAPIAVSAALILTACGSGLPPDGQVSDRPGSPLGGAPPVAPPSGAAALPGPDQPFPLGPAELAAAFTETSDRLHEAVDRWRRDGDPDRPGIPDDVELLALYEQRITRALARHPGRWSKVRPMLRGSVRAEAVANVNAASELLSTITPIKGGSSFETREPPPAAELLRYFKTGERRFGVDWEVLAAVCYVESKFARVLSDSTAGAQGPMQFIPSTWANYGMGGDVQDPHDAILAAANYLHASGAPGDDRGALFAYNPSSAYVDAVLRYAGQMREDPNDYFAYYAWQVFVLTTTGDERLTGPGL